MAKDNQWEGFMIRKNVGYEGKRSSLTIFLRLKHSMMQSMKLQDATSESTGLSEMVKKLKWICLPQVFIEHKGFKVAVGSGFSQQERIRYHKSPKDIIGKLITVAYFEETQNQDGDWSLRFPTVKVIHGAERTT